MGLPDIGQLLWAAQGSTTDERRTVPSAGALYPLEIYLVVGRVEDLPAGVYRYRPDTHDLQRESAGDVRRELADAAHEQEWVAAAPAVVVLAVVYERSTAKYGERGVRYAHMEVGHAAQNVYLEAAAQGLATVEVGAFHDERVAKVLGLKSNIRPVALMPVGKS
jgi:SagB-type dehydrogenase family enzyme